MKKRAMRKKIPYGFYCDSGYDRNGHIVVCPWFRWNKQAQQPRCAYLHMTSSGSGGEDLLWDGCKECSIHFDDDERIERRIRRRTSGKKSDRQARALRA